MPIIKPYRGVYPKIHKTAFIADDAVIIGDVEIGAHSSIWFGCVVRGDVSFIRIGKNSNIQDNSTIHVSRKDGPTIVGDNVTVGHNVLLHACTLNDNTFVGMKSVVMDNVVFEPYSMLAAGSLLTMSKRLLTNELWGGHPAKFMRQMKDDEREHIRISAENYVTLANDFISQTL
jgi:gamma-carbonic anhydrase